MVALIATRPGLVRDPSRLRFAWVPPWAWDLLLAVHADPKRLHPTAPLFASPSDPWRPRSALNPALRRACEEAFGPEGPFYTFGDLRRGWQAWCRGHRLPHRIVRQSWYLWWPPSHPGPVRWPQGAFDLQRVAASWTTLAGPAASPLWEPAPVPREAAKGTPANQPEPLPRERPEPLELPDSCRLD